MQQVLSEQDYSSVGEALICHKANHGLPLVKDGVCQQPTTRVNVECSYDRLLELTPWEILTLCFVQRSLREKI